jgi:hypothetical protein
MTNPPNLGDTPQIQREPYDRIIGLGGTCQETWNVRHSFGFSRAYPFDWWITPGNSLVAALEDDMVDRHKLENLAIIGDNTVLCRKYDILLHHDFRRDAAHKIIADLESQIEQVRNKAKFLWERMLSDCADGHVLFVRGDGGSYHELNGWRPPNTWGRDLYGVLRRKFPKLCFDLMIVSHHFGRREDGNIIYDKPDEIGEPTGDYRGWPDGWSEMFARWGLRLKDERRDTPSTSDADCLDLAKL